MYLYGHRKTLLTEIPRDKITTRLLELAFLHRAVKIVIQHQVQVKELY